MTAKSDRIRAVETRLQAWAARHRALQAQCAALHAITGAAPDCALLQPVYSVWGAYTVAVSELIGDTSEWLQWYEEECDMGRSPKEVRHIEGKSITVRTLRDLARVICG